MVKIMNELVIIQLVSSVFMLYSQGIAAYAVWLSSVEPFCDSILVRCLYN